MRWSAPLLALLACAPASKPSPGADTGTGTSDPTSDPGDDTTDPTSEPTPDTGEPTSGDDTGTAAPPSPYADCTSVVTYSTGGVTTSHYDADGRLSDYTYDADGDGSPEDSARYHWDVVGGVVQQSDWSTASGTSGTVWYDAHGHAERARTVSAAGTVDATYTNTHDASDRLVQVVTRTSAAAAITTTDYDGCELWTRQVIDLYGDGATLLESTSDWTYAAGCTPSSQRVGGSAVYTVDYDADGRPIEQRSGGAVTARWTWTCP
ncbi:MAG: hypothetical protein R3F59_20985 [Myxococcota bacterium]